MEKEKRNRSGWIFLISFIGLILTMVFLHEKIQICLTLKGRVLLKMVFCSFFHWGLLEEFF